MVQLTDLSGNSLGVCSSAIIGGGSTDENGNPVAVLGTNFLRAFYSVFKVNSAAGTAQVCHGPPLERMEQARCAARCASFSARL